MIKQVLDNIDPQINEILRKSSAVISGSFVLYYYMLENGFIPNFTPNDIDIYINPNERVNNTSVNLWNQWYEEYTSKLENKVEYQNRNSFNLSFHPFWFLNNCSELTEQFGPFIDLILMVNPIFLTNMPQQKIDLIYLRDKEDLTPTKFVRKYFDLDAVKCYYDGHKITHIFPETIINMKMNLVALPIIDHSRVDLFKLEQYISAIKSKDFNYQYDPLNILKRIQKYESRGFTINARNLNVKISHESEYYKHLQFVLQKLGIYINTTNFLNLGAYTLKLAHVKTQDKISYYKIE